MVRRVQQFVISGPQAAVYRGYLALKGQIMDCYRETQISLKSISNLQSIRAGAIKV